MPRIIQNNSAAGAMSYYSTADYYSEGQELLGQWRGQGAERLELAGGIDKATWDALCDNRDPATGLPLTARRNQERTVGYDFNFHVPNSVSVPYGLTRDERILDAFQTSVDETMRDIEWEMKTRVRVYHSGAPALSKAVLGRPILSRQIITHARRCVIAYPVCVIPYAPLTCCIWRGGSSSARLIEIP